MKNINLIDDDIYTLFWKIALPSSVGTVFQNLYSLVDAIFAGRMISEIALAAIGQTFPIYFIIIALGIGLSIATTSIVANSIGEKNISKGCKIFCQSLGLAIFVGIIISSETPLKYGELGFKFSCLKQPDAFSVRISLFIPNR